MKGRMLLLGVLLLMPITILLADWNPGNYVPKPNEFSNATWINDKSTNPYHIQKLTVEWHWEGTVPYDEWKQFYNVSDTTPMNSGTDDHIDSVWTDSEGNVWFKSYGTIERGSGAGNKYQSLTKISKDGTTRQAVIRNPLEFDSSNWPNKIDPNDYNYYVFYRAKE